MILSEEQHALRDASRRFATERLLPHYQQRSGREGMLYREIAALAAAHAEAIRAGTPRHWRRQVLELQPLGTAATRLTRTVSGCSRSPLARWADRWTLARAWAGPAQDALAALKLKLEAVHAPPEVVPPPVPRWRAER